MPQSAAALVFVVVLVLGLFTLASGCSPKVRPELVESKGIDVWAVESKDKERLLSLLRPRRVTAEVFALVVPADLVEITQRMKDAAVSDPIGTIAVFKNVGDDGFAKYDRRMGITREEYERFKNVPNLMVLDKLGEARLDLESPTDSTVRITGLPEMDEVVFDAEKMSVKTKYGKLTGAIPVKPDEKQLHDKDKLIGKTAGFRWRTDSVAPLLSLLVDDFTLWHAQVGQSQETLDVWMDFRVKNNKTRQDHLMYFVRFPGPR